MMMVAAVQIAAAPVIPAALVLKTRVAAKILTRETLSAPVAPHLRGPSAVVVVAA